MNINSYACKSRLPRGVYIDIGDLRIYYSYNTIIALKFQGHLLITENIWSSTTGKHLNYICPDKSKRINIDVFNRAKKEILDNIGDTQAYSYIFQDYNK
jgi:hypothetical protein